MNLEYISLLQVQRDLYALPRGFERFSEYLRTMIDADTGDLKLPLVAMNPMGKDHLPPFLDKLLEIDADGEAARAVAEAQAIFKTEPGDYKVCLVVSDDLLGGWTNRTTSEFGYRFAQKPFYRRGWIVGLLWTSESYTPEQVGEEIKLCLFRADYVQRHGYARTLGEMLAQEGYAMKLAGAKTPTLDPDDLAYTREVLAPYLSNKDQPTLIAALDGDVAARELGYPPLGLSPRAGLALARDNAKSVQV
jgi:hypothetical protein